MSARGRNKQAPQMAADPLARMMPQRPSGGGIRQALRKRRFEGRPGTRRVVDELPARRGRSESGDQKQQSNRHSSACHPRPTLGKGNVRWGRDTVAIADHRSGRLSRQGIARPSSLGKPGPIASNGSEGADKNHGSHNGCPRKSRGRGLSRSAPWLSMQTGRVLRGANYGRCPTSQWSYAPFSGYFFPVRPADGQHRPGSSQPDT